MLEQIRKLMAEVLQTTSADVIKTREALLAEQAAEDARYAATTALLHPEGSSTPIEEAYSRAQDRFATIRKQLEKELPKVMALMMAAEAAQQRRDDAQRHREQKLESNWAKRLTCLHAAARDWIGRLLWHGVHPHYLKQHSNETVAIIADLIIWKAKDAKFADADNPWRQVLGIYAHRKINKPGRKGRKGGSIPGIPKADRHNVDSGDYRFDEMVSAAWGIPMPVHEPVQAELIEPPAVPVTSLAAPTTDSFEGDEAEKPEQEGDTGSQPVAASAEVDFAEYALPAHIDSEGASRLRIAATPLVEGGDFDESLFELKWALNDKVDALSDEQAIALVSSKLAPRGCTPFMYFVEGARLGGRMAGVAAYREATIRRTMLMIATEPNFMDARKRLGLE